MLQFSREKSFSFNGFEKTKRVLAIISENHSKQAIQWYPIKQKFTPTLHLRGKIKNNRKDIFYVQP